VFENKVLRRIFGQKRVGMAESWKKLHNEALHNSKLFAEYISKACITHGIEDLVGKAKGKIPHGGPIRRRESNI
jgi:hypothetical protein